MISSYDDAMEFDEEGTDATCIFLFGGVFLFIYFYFSYKGMVLFKGCLNPPTIKLPFQEMMITK